MNKSIAKNTFIILIGILGGFGMLLMYQNINLVKEYKSIYNSHIQNLVDKGNIELDLFNEFQEGCQRNSSELIFSIKPYYSTVSSSSSNHNGKCDDFKVSNESFMRLVNNVNYSSVKAPRPLIWFH